MHTGSGESVRRKTQPQLETSELEIICLKAPKQAHYTTKLISRRQRQIGLKRDLVVLSAPKEKQKPPKEWGC